MPVEPEEAEGTEVRKEGTWRVREGRKRERRERNRGGRRTKKKKREMEKKGIQSGVQLHVQYVEATLNTLSPNSEVF